MQINADFHARVFMGVFWRIPTRLHGARRLR